MTIEDKLKNLILLRYEKMTIFTKAIGIPNSTFQSILNRGIMNANMSSIAKICSALHISIDHLVRGEIIPTSNLPEPEPIDIGQKLNTLCTEIRSRDQIRIDGAPASHEAAENAARLLESASAYIRNASE